MVCVRDMTYQPKRELTVNVVSATAPGASVAPTKNTRRRIQQKRTRNRSGGGGGGGGGNNYKSSPSPVIESSNPFFIAVCSPESYKPGFTHKMDNTPSRAPVPAVPTRTRPNVFLRQPSRSSSTLTTGGSSSYPNQFIHNPRLQNERHRDSSASVTASVATAVAATAVAATTTNINDTVQFPSLSSSVSAVVNTSKLNFKEMMLKNKNPASAPVVPVVPVPVPVPVAPLYVPANVYQKPLSSGNIFSSAFYGPPEPVDCDDYDNSATAVVSDRSSVSISSVLVDSCDRKYDKLYR